MTTFGKMAFCSLILALISHSLYASYWESDSLLEEKTLYLKTDAIHRVLVDAGAGDIEIFGDTQIDAIKVIAKIYGQNLQDSEYLLSLEEKEGRAVLYAHTTQKNNNNERIDLKITVPAKLKLEVKDRSGDINIEAMQGGVSIDDRSGHIDLKDISGGLEIDDRSGDISAVTIVGNIVINDRSGDINLITVVGDTKIHDRSGEIRIKTLKGNLDIDDSSGDIRVKSVTGVVTVEDSSGKIDVDGAEDFVLVADGSGGVDLDNIRSRSGHVIE